jgi:hypothetical protein
MKVFTVPAGFEKLKSDLEITGLQSSIVSNSSERCPRHNGIGLDGA